MTNKELLKKAFVEALNLPPETDVEALQYNSIPEWDSLAHMALISQLDDVFDIMIDTEDVIDLSSYQKAEEILSKYGVTF
ncbi:acyl carrier protein [Brevibacillus borstelensis]|uniref:acyl carrier protein n=1 Tax=Brevibacillus borstelensis TaxID=45462 RepID=UPI002E1A415F|nr:acyl carrier protein [Brevibacillus borstelensis]MED2007479.1 acyl carrier protein [Brevibacillus borstelensis]